MILQPFGSGTATTGDWVPFFDQVKTAGILGAGSDASSLGWRTAFLLHANGVKVYVISPGAPSRLSIRCVSAFEEIREQIDLIDCFSDGGDLGEENIREVIARGVRAVWLEPGFSLRAGAEALLDKADITIVRGLSLYGEYLYSYSCA